MDASAEKFIQAKQLTDDPTLELPSGPWPRSAAMCIACHDQPEQKLVGPYLPFKSPSKFRAVGRSIGIDYIAEVKRRTDPKNISADKGGHRMPLGQRALDEAEQAELIHYLEN